MQKNNLIIIAVVAVVVVVAAVGAWWFLGNSGDDNGGEAKNSMTFLIQDNEGIYFWVEGEGDTAIAAFENAVDKYDIPYEATTNPETGASRGITALFDIESEKVTENTWVYWSQYVWEDGTWTYSMSFMDGVIVSGENNYMAILYGSGDIDLTTLPTPSDAVIWDKSTEGTVFTIQSSSGMYFQVNGTGTTVLDAYKAAMDEYKIPYETSMYNGEETGIESMFGLEMTQEPVDTGTKYSYWAQYYYEDGGWAYSDYMMNQLNSSENPQCKVVYEVAIF